MSRMGMLLLTRSLAFVGLMKSATSAFSMVPLRAISTCNMLHPSKVNKIFPSKVIRLQSTLTPHTDFSVELKASYPNHIDLLIIPVLAQGHNTSFPDLSILPESLTKIISGVSKDMMDSLQADSMNSFQKEIFRIYPNYHNIKHIAFVKFCVTDKDKVLNEVHQFGKTIASIISEKKVQRVGLLGALPFSSTENISGIFTGMYDMLYEDCRFKGSDFKGTSISELCSFNYISGYDSTQISVADAKFRADSIAKGVYLARDIVGAPSNWKTPEQVATIAESLARDNMMDCKVLGLEECQRLNMGAYLAVQQGSKFPPKFLHLTYRGSKAPSDPKLTKIALVGKGLTFDSGGYNLKSGPSSMIELMKFDVGGCAAVLGAAVAIGHLRPENVEVHFISPLCENMISADAMRPGDIVKASNGVSIEIINTDAEGRLALADALCYAESLNVDAIVDVATLTGACIIGLGEHVAGLFSNDARLKDAIASSSLQSSEPVWCLPLEKLYLKSIQSNIADLKNLASAKGGGSITAALFLQHFVKRTPWAHIDIAGPTWDYISNKPTGFGVKLLVNFVLQADAATLKEN